MVPAVVYREIPLNQITSTFLDGFARTQVVTAVAQPDPTNPGNWVEVAADWIDDWDGRTREAIAQSLAETVRQGGLVEGAFVDSRLVPGWLHGC